MTLHCISAIFQCIFFFRSQNPWISPLADAIVIVVLQLNEFSKAPLSTRISRWSPNMRIFFLLSIDRRFAVSIFVMRHSPREIQRKFRKQFAARTIALSFRFPLHSTTPFVLPPPFFYISIIEPFIESIDDTGRILFSQALRVIELSLKFRSIGLFGAEQDRRCRSPSAFERPIPLLEFFFHPFNRLFGTNSDFRISGMHLRRRSTNLHSTRTDYWTV